MSKGTCGTGPSLSASPSLYNRAQPRRAGAATEARGNSAIDVVLWDVLGQSAGQPLYQLLGGLFGPRRGSTTPAPVRVLIGARGGLMGRTRCRTGNLLRSGAATGGQRNENEDPHRVHWAEATRRQLAPVADLSAILRERATR